LSLRAARRPSGFDVWYRRLQGGDRQVGGIGSAVIANVPAAQLPAFEARRDDDPVFRALLGKWLAPIQRGHQARYCVLAAGGEIIPLPSLTASLVQEDSCDPGSLVGSSQASMLQAAADTASPSGAA